MNNKIKAIGIIAILMAFVGIQVIAAQQANDYRAYVGMQKVTNANETDPNNATMGMQVTYVPIYGSATYALTSRNLYTTIDMSQPTKINDQIAAAVKADGATRGYNVIRVFIPSYEMKIP